GDTQGTLDIFAAADEKLEHSSLAMYKIQSLAFAPNGDRVYAVVGSEDVYAFPTDGSAETLLTAPIWPVAAVAPSPDGQSLLVANTESLWLVDTAGHQLRDGVPVGPFAHSVAFWPDGTELVIAGNQGVVVRAVPDGTVTKTLELAELGKFYNGVAVSPDA